MLVSIKVDKEIDARGLKCPLPILRTKKALAELVSGQILRVLSTDVGSMKDFEILSTQTGNTLLEITQVEQTFIFLIQRR